MAESYDELFRLAMLKGKPICGVLELTERCQQSCLFCLKDRQITRDLPLSFWMGLLPQLADAGVFEIQFSGGEPLLYNELPALVMRAKQLGFRLLVTTNGNHPAEQIGKWARAIHKFRVSIHGPNPDVHDAIVGSYGAFERAVAFARAVKSIGCEVSIAYVVNALNADFIERSYQFFTEIGLKFTVSLQLLSNAATRDINSACRLSDAQLLKAASDLERLGLALPRRKPDEGFACNAGRNTFSVGADGTLFPCIVFRKPIGNLLQATFSELWDSHEMRDVRALRDEQLPCFTCEYHDHCEFCPGEAWNLTGTMTARVADMCRTGIALSEVRRLCVP